MLDYGRRSRLACVQGCYSQLRLQTHLGLPLRRDDEWTGLTMVNIKPYSSFLEDERRGRGPTGVAPANPTAVKRLLR